MTTAPDSLLAARKVFKRHTNLRDISLGIIGSRQHHRVGTSYHISAQECRNGAYSTRHSRDRVSHSYACALDIGPFNDLQDFSRWIAQQCRNGAPGTEDIREVIYSPDGRNVKRWDYYGESSTGGDSHLWHTHISFHRNSIHNLDTFISLIESYFTNKPAPTKPRLPESDIDMQLPMIEKGTQSWHVKIAQALLNVHGESIAEDSIFGPKTDAATRDFQADQNIGIDGIIGPVTWGKLLDDHK